MRVTAAYFRQRAESHQSRSEQASDPKKQSHHNTMAALFRVAAKRRERREASLQERSLR